MSSNKRVKHTASGKVFKPKKALKKGSSSRQEQGHEDENMEEDPHFTLAAQEERITQFDSRNLMALRYANSQWLRNEGFLFPALLDTQNITKFIDLNGKIYPTLVKEFYANFLFRDDTYMTMIKGVRIILDDALFLTVGGLSNAGISIQDCTDDRWAAFDTIEFYKSCLRNENLYVAGKLKKAGLFTVDNRVLHYVLVYLLMPRKSNLSQPNDMDLKFMFAIKNGIVLNWTNIILSQMHDMSNLKSTRPLGYGIFISRIIDHLGIDTNGQIIQKPTESKNLIGDNVTFHQMKIYKQNEEWVYQYDPAEDIDLDDDMHDEQEGEQQAQDPDSENASIPGISIAHLDALEQRMNARIDQRFATLTDYIGTRMDEGFRAQGEAIQAQFDHISFLMRSLGGFQTPPNP